MIDSFVKVINTRSHQANILVTTTIAKPMLPILDFIEDNVVGGDTKFVGPYGTKKGNHSILFYMI